MIKIGVIVMALFGFLQAGWFANLFDSTPTPPIAVPIDLSKKGSTAEVVIRSDDSDKSRYFSIYFVVGVSGVIDKLHEHLSETFIGYGPRQGVITPVRLTIYRIKKDKEPILFLDKTIEAGESHFRGFELNGQKVIYDDRYIYATELPEGKYRIRLKNLQDFPELKEIETYFAIHGGRGKY